MIKSLCPAQDCGKKFISKEHASAHADAEHPGWKTPRARGWATPDGFVDFSQPVTYEHACGVAKRLRDCCNQFPPRTTKEE